MTLQQTAVLKPTPQQNKFAKFDKVTDYQTVNTYEIGGSKPEFHWKAPLNFEAW